MAKIVVTGGSGFIGTNLISHLEKRGDSVLNVDLLPPRNPAHIQYWHRMDIRELSSLFARMDEFAPEYIVHLAARTDLRGLSVEDYSSNTDGVSNVIRVAKDLRSLSRIVFASSMLVCRPGYQPRGSTDYCPHTVYGQSKVLGESFVRAASTDDLPWTIVRPTSIWGPWFASPYRDFFETVRRRLFVKPHGIQIRRSFGFAPNTAYQLDSLMRADKTWLGRTTYLADYEPIDIHAWSDCIADAFSVKRPISLPLFTLKLIASAGDFCQKLGVPNPPLNSFRLRNLLTSSVYPLDELHTLTGDLPYSWQSGVNLTSKWMSE